VRDEVSEVVAPLLLAGKPAATGRPRVPGRVAFDAIVFVLVSGIAWRFVPQGLGCSGVTAWRRLRDWQAAGVWERAHAVLMERLNAAGVIDWSASVVDGSHIGALEQAPPRAGGPRRQADHRPPRSPARLRPGTPPLGRRAHLRLAALLPPPATALRIRRFPWARQDSNLDLTDYETCAKRRECG
jgi:transposase